MGAKIPPAPEKQEPKPNKSPEPEKINPNKAEEMEQDEERLDGEAPEEDPESDIELDMSGVIGNSDILYIINQPCVSFQGVEGRRVAM